MVTDLIMPGMDGKTFHDAVKRLRPDAKVVFVSGYAADLLSERGLVGPGVHFLAKPLRLELLLRKIREALAG